MLGMLTPHSHVALEDIHHTFGERQLALLPSVFASSSGRAMAEGVSPLLTFHVAKMQVRQNILTTATLLTFLKKREILTKLLSVCRIAVTFRGKRQGRSIQMTVSAMNVLTDRRCVQLGFFHEPFTEHLSAFTNFLLDKF